MLKYILRRCVTMAWTLLIIPALIFAIINLPDGNYLTNQIRELMVTGEEASIANAKAVAGVVTASQTTSSTIS